MMEMKCNKSKEMTAKMRFWVKMGVFAPSTASAYSGKMIILGKKSNTYLAKISKIGVKTAEKT